MKLTKPAVDAFKSGDKHYAAWDSELKGFGVMVATAGRRVS